MFGNFFKDKMDALVAEAGKFRDRQTAEALVAVMTGAAYADGSFSAAEKQKLIAAFNVNPILKQFNISDLIGKFNDLSTQCEFDLDVGLGACLKEVADVKGTAEEKRIAVLRLGVAAAKADGDLGEPEKSFIRKVASVLDVSPSVVGL